MPITVIAVYKLPALSRIQPSPFSYSNLTKARYSTQPFRTILSQTLCAFNHPAHTNGQSKPPNNSTPTGTYPPLNTITKLSTPLPNPPADTKQQNGNHSKPIQIDKTSGGKAPHSLPPPALTSNKPTHKRPTRALQFRSTPALHHHLALCATTQYRGTCPPPKTGAQARITRVLRPTNPRMPTTIQQLPNTVSIAQLVCAGYFRPHLQPFQS